MTAKLKSKPNGLTRQAVAKQVRACQALGARVKTMIDNGYADNLIRQAARKVWRAGVALQELGASAGRWRNFITAQVLLESLKELEYRFRDESSYEAPELLLAQRLIKTLATYDGHWTIPLLK